MSESGNIEPMASNDTTGRSPIGRYPECPNCGSDDVKRVGKTTFFGEPNRITYYCRTCRGKWTDYVTGATPW